MYSCACRSSTKTRLVLPRSKMLAMAGPDLSPMWVCHSLRSRLEVGYSVRVSEKPPVTWRVTILTPLKAGSGRRNEFNEIRSSDNTRILTLLPRCTPRGPYCNPDEATLLNVCLLRKNLTAKPKDRTRTGSGDLAVVRFFCNL